MLRYTYTARLFTLFLNIVIENEVIKEGKIFYSSFKSSFFNKNFPPFKKKSDYLIGMTVY